MRLRCCFQGIDLSFSEVAYFTTDDRLLSSRELLNASSHKIRQIRHPSGRCVEIAHLMSVRKIQSAALSPKPTPRSLDLLKSIQPDAKQWDAVNAPIVLGRPQLVLLRPRCTQYSRRRSEAWHGLRLLALLPAEPGSLPNRNASSHIPLLDAVCSSLHHLVLFLVSTNSKPSLPGSLAWPGGLRSPKPIRHEI